MIADERIFAAVAATWKRDTMVRSEKKLMNRRVPVESVR